MWFLCVKMSIYMLATPNYVMKNNTYVKQAYSSTCGIIVVDVWNGIYHITRTSAESDILCTNETIAERVIASEATMNA